MATLPIMSTSDQTLSMLQTRWSSILNPIISSPLSDAILLTDIPISFGDNSINHTLGQPIVGYIVVRINGPTTLYDKDSSTPNLTFILNSSSNQMINVDILVF